MSNRKIREQLGKILANGLSFSSRVLTKRYLDKYQQEQKRPALQAFNLLTSLGHPHQGIKLCLLTESWMMRASSPSSVNTLPLVIQIYNWQKVELKGRLAKLKSPIRWVSKALSFKNLLIAGSSESEMPELVSNAGLFQGMEYRYISSVQDEGGDEYENYYELITKEASSVKDNYESLLEIRNAGKSQSECSPVIGILISCYKPEKYLDNFLVNLTSLSNCEQLIPVFINAGMTDNSLNKIKSLKNENSFKNLMLIDAPDSRIYEAWNIGVKALDGAAEFITNFNVDDKRHPLCLELQALCLQTYEDIPVCTTDYLYFFDPSHSVEKTYQANQNNSTFIPVVNSRTIFYRNLPHASPMWRSELHRHDDCGLFDETYLSAGDADFWYRVSRNYPSTAHVLSIPLSLYFQNPEGLSTKPDTTGVIEHKRSSDEHAKFLNETIIDSISAEMSTQFDVLDSEYMQLRAMAKKVEKQRRQR